MHMATVSGDELFLVFQGETGREQRKQEREWEARQEAISVEVLQPSWKDSVPGWSQLQMSMAQTLSSEEAYRAKSTGMKQAQAVRTEKEVTSRDLVSTIKMGITLYLCKPHPQHLIKCLVYTKCLKKCQLLSRFLLFMTPWTIAHQAPSSMGFSRQEYWSGLPFPSPMLKNMLNK